MSDYRILWMMNKPLPNMSKRLGINDNNKEGWLSGLYMAVKEFAPRLLTKIAICFPCNTVPEGGENTEALRFEEDGVVYYGIFEDTAHPEYYDECLKKSVQYVLDDFKPELIHIFGTEYAHATEMAKQAKERKDKGEKINVIVAMQGVMHKCAEEYMCFLPEEIYKQKTFRDFIKKDSLVEQQEKFWKRAEFEKETLENVDYVFGRTKFDNRETKKINQDLTYFHIDEILREEFFSGEWGEDKCTRHSVFASQGNYPLKGIHQAIKALAIVKEKYPDVMLRVAGDNITAYATIKDKIKISGYGKFLRELIQKNGLQDNVEFIGSVDASRMKEEFLKANVFICPSSVENSPNSVGEAMLLGVPVVAAYVGGIMDMMEPDTEGLYYDAKSPEELAERIMQVFEGGNEMKHRLINARNRAANTHDRKKNALRLCELYHKIMEG